MVKENCGVVGIYSEGDVNVLRVDKAENNYLNSLGKIIQNG